MDKWNDHITCTTTGRRNPTLHQLVDGSQEEDNDGFGGMRDNGQRPHDATAPGVVSAFAAVR